MSKNTLQPAASTSTTFDTWMLAVDGEIERRSGLTSADLPDCLYHDWFDDGVSPSTAASRAIAAVDGDDDDDDDDDDDFDEKDWDGNWSAYDGDDIDDAHFLFND